MIQIKDIEKTINDGKLQSALISWVCERLPEIVTRIETGDLTEAGDVSYQGVVRRAGILMNEDAAVGTIRSGRR